MSDRDESDEGHQRTGNGIKVYVGEYAAHDRDRRRNRLRSALAETAGMTAFECSGEDGQAPAVKPAVSEVTLKPTFDYETPANSLTVFRMLQSRFCFRPPGRPVMLLVGCP